MKLPQFSNNPSGHFEGSVSEKQLSKTSMGIVPMADDDKPSGDLCNDPSRMKEYVGPQQSILGRKSQTIKCPCVDSTGSKFWGYITKRWVFEGDNTLSCPTQKMVRPHWTEPGKHPYTVYKCVPPSSFDKVEPDNNG